MSETTECDAPSPALPAAAKGRPASLDGGRPSLAQTAVVPHWGLAAGHLAHLVSWIALAVLAARGQLGFSLPGLAWVHLVTLGWLTLVSLAMLVHVLEEVLGLKWPGGLAVRSTLAPYALGVAGLVTSFWLSSPRGIALSAVVVVGAIAAWLAYAVGAFASFVPSPERSVRAKQAFQLVLLMLAATATLGLGMAWTLGFGGPSWWLAYAPAVHAHLGALGWLTLLVVGVAQRTMGALFGRRSVRIVFHVVALTCFVLALVPVTIALSGGPAWLLTVAWALGAAGVASHALDIGWIGTHAVSRHRPPQAFVAAATGWLAVAVVLGGGVLAGHDWKAAYAVAALVGWAGQMVNGHLHHVPIVAFSRLAGIKPEPARWLRPPLSWGAFASMQVAVGLAIAAALAALPVLGVAAGLCGAAGWAMMTANVAGAWPRVREAGAAAKG